MFRERLANVLDESLYNLLQNEIRRRVLVVVLAVMKNVQFCLVQKNINGECETVTLTR
jgi:hypothetical protein